MLNYFGTFYFVEFKPHDFKNKGHVSINGICVTVWVANYRCVFRSQVQTGRRSGDAGRNWHLAAMSARMWRWTELKLKPRLMKRMIHELQTLPCTGHEIEGWLLMPALQTQTVYFLLRNNRNNVFTARSVLK